MVRTLIAVLMSLALVACAPLPPPPPGPTAQRPALQPAGQRLSPQAAARNFAAVVARVKPVAEAECRARRPRANCDFLILVDDRPNLPPNAFQTLDRNGRPVIAFTVALIAEARNADELAFVLGHEAGHHIAGHIPRVQQSALAGALILGTLASIGGAAPEAVETAQRVGATVGARRYSQDFELEADAIGTVIAFRAGFDPERGAAYFSRLPDPGNRFLGTHPPNARRIDVVRRTLASLR